MKGGACSSNLYILNAKNPEGIGWNLTMRCENLYFTNVNKSITKFGVNYALSQTSPPQGEFLISPEPSNEICQGFFYLRGVIRPHRLSSCSWDRHEISSCNSKNIVGGGLSYEFTNNHCSNAQHTCNSIRMTGGRHVVRTDNEHLHREEKGWCLRAW